MFINCPACEGLVATDPVTDLPPERCPRCGEALREAATGEEQAEVPAEDTQAADAAASTPTSPEPAGTGAADMPGAPDTSDAMDPVDGDAEVGADAALTAVPEGAPAEESTEATEATEPAEALAEPKAPEGQASPAPGAGDAEDNAAEPALPPAASPEPPTALAGKPPRAGRAAPSFAHRRSGDAAPGRRWPMAAAIVALALLLGLQWLLSDRARLAADPAWRPTLERTCALLRCSLPPWREDAAFALLERDVRPHPEVADALRITASFRNDAAWPQPWPEVVLTLSDIDGRPLGVRAFGAAEYLGAAPSAPLVGPGEGAVIRLEVLEPAAGAVSFSFDLRAGSSPMAGTGPAR